MLCWKRRLSLLQKNTDVNFCPGLRSASFSSTNLYSTKYKVLNTTPNTVPSVKSTKIRGGEEGIPIMTQRSAVMKSSILKEEKRRG